LSAQVMPSQLCLVCGHRLTSWQLGDKWTDNRTSGQPAQPSSREHLVCAVNKGVLLFEQFQQVLCAAHRTGA
jgi:hypothetical protein